MIKTERKESHFERLDSNDFLFHFLFRPKKTKRVVAPNFSLKNCPTQIVFSPRFFLNRKVTRENKKFTTQWLSPDDDHALRQW